MSRAKLFHSVPANSTLASLGPTLKHILSEKKITMTSFAVRIGISKAFMYDICNSRFYPTLGLLDKIATELGMPVEHLLFQVILFKEKAVKPATQQDVRYWLNWTLRKLKSL